MGYTIVRKSVMEVALAAVMLLAPGVQAQAGHNPKTAVLHATVTVTGGVKFTGSYDQRLPISTCAEVAKTGTQPASRSNATAAAFYLPQPPNNTSGNGGPVGGGHTFAADVSATPYHGPGTYTGSGLNATQLDADTPPDSQETHIFAFPTAIGTMVIKADASGSFQFNGLQDPGSVTISGQVSWTCSEQ
jgi:hypothetical protein